MASYKRHTIVDERLHDYLVAHQPAERPELARLREETAELPDAGMQIAPEQAPLLSLLVRLVGAKRTLEIGCFTGYSAMAVAFALPKDGRIITCDISEEFTTIARKHWQAAGVANRIDLCLGPASTTLDSMLNTVGPGSFDFAFIDADKSGYDGYYEQCLKLVRKGGIIAIDNTLWDGKVADPDVNDEDTAAIRALNAKIARDDRVESCLLAVSDGFTVCRVR